MSNKESKKQKQMHIIEGEKLQLIALKFTNGFFITICHLDEGKLGTMALSLPVTPLMGISRERKQKTRSSKKGITSTTVIGSRNEVITKALAEKITLNSGKMVYLSTHFKDQDEEMTKEALNLLESYLEKHL
ncbi:MAG: hypothetical protein U9O98_10740 [Asgard group archaeon]|nr:hypothetical protein [Asgard group archaeon]